MDSGGGQASRDHRAIEGPGREEPGLGQDPRLSLRAACSTLVYCDAEEERLLEEPIIYLTKEAFWSFLEEEAELHPEISRWFREVREKWQRSFFRLLRSSGIMAEPPCVEVRRRGFR